MREWPGLLHSLLYSKELHERGHDVRLVFDGAGTEWAARLHQPDGDEKIQRLSGLFAEAEGWRRGVRNLRLLLWRLRREGAPAARTTRR